MARVFVLPLAPPEWSDTIEQLTSMKNIFQQNGTQLLIGLLLVLLGSVAGYRVGATGVLIPGLDLGIIGQDAPYAKVINSDKPEQYSDVNFQQFWTAWRYLENEYLNPEKLQADAMVHGAISGLAKSIGDPYTTYLPPQENQRATEDLQGSFYGVGIQLGYIDETLAVIAPLKGSPAEEAGVQAGDLILNVRDEGKELDESTDDWSLDEAVNKIRGEKGTEVVLTLYRSSQDNSQPFDVSIPRGEIVVPTVEVSFVEQDGGRYAHISLSSFGERTDEEWDDIVNQITQRTATDGVILDMRNNPGGIFDQAVVVAGDFAPNQTIVSQRGRYNSKPIRSQGSGRLEDYPVVVLVNQGSASASEIVAGALEDLIAAPAYRTADLW